MVVLLDLLALKFLKLIGDELLSLEVPVHLQLQSALAGGFQVCEVVQHRVVNTARRADRDEQTGRGLPSTYAPRTNVVSDVHVGVAADVRVGRTDCLRDKFVDEAVERRGSKLGVAEIEVGADVEGKRVLASTGLYEKVNATRYSSDERERVVGDGAFPVPWCGLCCSCA